MNRYELDSDDDDIVVSEFPIYHSTRLKDNVYVFQYTNDTTASFKEDDVKKIFFKPENQELKYTIESDRKNDSDDEDEDITIYSQKVINAPQRVAVASFNGKEFHLTTIKNAFDFNVDYYQPDKGVKEKKVEEVEDSEDEAGPSDAKQITVKFKQTLKPNQKRTVSSRSHNAKIQNEKWVECELASSKSTISQVEKIKLQTDYMHETSQGNNLDEMNYFKHLIPEDQEQSTDEPSLPSHLISLNALRALPLLEQCRLLLKGSQIIQFQQISMLLAGCSGLTTDSLLKTLPQVAVLVRGNWVVKSEVLYPPDSLSAICGVPADNMCRARDYLLYLFTKNQFVERKKVASIVKVPAEEIKEIFKGVSSLRHNRGWELNLDTDYDFIAKYPDIEQRQNLLWEQRFIQVCNFFKEKKRRKSRSESKSISEDKKSGHCYSSDDSGTEKTKSPPRKKKRTE